MKPVKAGFAKQKMHEAENKWHESMQQSCSYKENTKTILAHLPKLQKIK